MARLTRRSLLAVPLALMGGLLTGCAKLDDEERNAVVEDTRRRVQELPGFTTVNLHMRDGFDAGFVLSVVATRVVTTQGELLEGARAALRAMVQVADEHELDDDLELHVMVSATDETDHRFATHWDVLGEGAAATHGAASLGAVREQLGP